jgi:hypothetical protein
LADPSNFRVGKLEPVSLLKLRPQASQASVPSRFPCAHCGQIIMIYLSSVVEPTSR